MAFVAAPSAAAQQPEPVIQPGQDLGRRQRPHPRRGQFDRQRDAIQTGADGRDRRPVCVVEREPIRRRRGPFGEQAARRPCLGQATAPAAPLRPAGPMARGWWPAPSLPVRPAGWRPPSGDVVQHVFAVVQDQQRRAGPQPGHDRLGHRRPRLELHAQGGGDRGGHGVTGAHRSELHQPHPSRELVAAQPADLDCRAGLADATGTRQRHQPAAPTGHPLGGAARLDRPRTPSPAGAGCPRRRRQAVGSCSGRRRRRGP